MASQPAAATEKPDAEPRSWAQRISALHRSSVDLTSELPVLETSAVPLVDPVVPLADPLLEDQYLQIPALERPEERSIGKEWFRPCRFRWAPLQSKQK